MKLRILPLLLLPLAACVEKEDYVPAVVEVETGDCDDPEQNWDPVAAACVPVECGPGPYPDAPEGAGRVLYVDPGFRGASNGSLTSPFPNVTAATFDLREGDTVLLATGEHWLESPLDIGVADVHVIGRCPQLSVIHTTGRGIRIGQAAGATLERFSLIGPGGHLPDEALLECFNGTNLLMRDLIVADAGWDGISLWQCSEVLVARTRVVNAARYGVFSAFSSLVGLNTVEIEDTRPDELGGAGFGLYVGQADTPTLTDLTVRGNAGGGVHVTESQDVELVGIVATDNGGPGVLVSLSGDAWLRESEISGSTGVGAMLSYTTGGVLDSSVVDTRSDADGLGGQGIFVINAQSVRIGGNTVAGNREVGIGLTLSTGRIAGNTITGTGPNALGEGGRGIEVSIVNDLLITDNLLDDNAEAGIVLLDGRATIEDNTILRTGRAHLPSGAYDWGHGIHVQVGGNVIVQGNVVDEATHAGIFLRGGSGTSVIGNEVSRTRSGPPPWKYGDGIEIVGLGGDIEVRDNVVTGHSRAGLLIDSTSVLAEGNELRDNGLALIVQNGADVDAASNTIEGNGVDALQFSFDRGWVVHDDEMERLIEVTLPDET